MSIVSLPTRKNLSRRSRKPKKNSSYLSWVKAHTSEIDLGLEVADAKGVHPVHLNRNEQVLGHFMKLREGEPSWLPARWNWLKIRNHGYGYATYFFAGAPERRKARTLFNLDVDCKRRGSPEGARAFLAYLATGDCAREYGHSFPGLYAEGSTHGRGGHGFAILDKQEHGAEFVNNLLLHRLQPWLNKVAQEKGFDIEFVEVKGTIPLVEWGEAKYEVRSYTAGCLAKLPREGEVRFEQLRNTSVITVHELLLLPVADKTTMMTWLSTDVSERTTASGSVSGRHITEDMLAGVREGGRYRCECRSRSAAP